MDESQDEIQSRKAGCRDESRPWRGESNNNCPLGENIGCLRSDGSQLGREEGLPGNAGAHSWKYSLEMKAAIRSGQEEMKAANSILLQLEETVGHQVEDILVSVNQQI